MKNISKRVVVALEVHKVDGDERKLVLGPIALFDDGTEVRSSSLETLANVIFEEDAVLVTTPQDFYSEDVVALPIPAQRKLERLLAERICDAKADETLEIGAEVVELLDAIKRRAING